MTLKAQIQSLSLQEKKQLQIWLTTLRAEEEAPGSSGRVLVQEERVGQVTLRPPFDKLRGASSGATYRQEWVRCGKEQCRCAGGELHGPYWYRYWREGGRYRSSYVGQRRPVEVKADTANLK